MSNVKNEAKIKSPLIVGIREQLEHRALWMYLLQDEAKKKGLDPLTYVPEAIHRCGLYQGANLVEKGGKGKSLKGLKKALFGFFARRVFEMDILQCDDDRLSIDFYYCPLVKAWQKQGCSDEEIALLCDCAMCGDRGIAESFGAHLELPQTIANGAETCQIRFARGEVPFEAPSRAMPQREMPPAAEPLTFAGDYTEPTAEQSRTTEEYKEWVEGNVQETPSTD